MSSINETQRKHLIKRVEAIKQTKIQQISRRASIPSLSRDARSAIMREELARVGLDWEIDMYGNIKLPEDRMHAAMRDAASAEMNTKIVLFNAEANKLLDQIILGDDAVELGAALEALSNFNTGEVN